MSDERVRQVNIHALYAALDVRRSEARMSWRDVAKTTGLSASTFSRMTSCHSPDLDSYATCCRWLGVSMDTFAAALPIASPSSLGVELVELLNRYGVPECYWRTLSDHIAALVRS